MRFPHRRRRVVDDNVAALLRDLATLRLTLDADLTVAASAAEADRFDLAADIVEFDSDELAAFTDAVQRRLTAPEAAPPHEHEDVPERQQARSGLPWRQRLAFAAAPAMLAAATVIAVVAVSGGGTANTAPQSAAPQYLVASYSALTELARSDNDPAALLAVGHELNSRVAQLIAAAAHDPAKARQAMRILQAERQLLIMHHPKGAAQLLAQAAALVQRLRQTVPSSVLSGAPVAATKQSLPAIVSGLPTAAQSPATHAHPSSGPTSQQSATANPPSQQPTPEPTTGDATVPPQPSPQPSVIDPWPFGSNGGFGDNGG